MRGVRGIADHAGMLHVRALLVCSEEGCAELFEACGPLEEVEALACECGCGLQLLGWPAEAGGIDRPDGLELIPLDR